MKIRKRFFRLCKLAGVYVTLYIITTAVFIGMFHTPVLKSMDVFMYKGTVFIVLSGIIAAILMALCMHFAPGGFITVRDVVLLSCICCCVNMVLFTLIPVTVERSVSVFMLSYMDENDDMAYTQDNIGDIFIDKYVNDYGAFEKRFHEQLVTGSICENEDGTYSITKRGKAIVRMFRIVAGWFHTDERLVYPNEN